MVAMSRHDEAAKAFRRGLECEPDNDDLKQKLADAERESRFQVKRVDDEGVRAAFGLLHTKNWKHAHSCCSDLCPPPRLQRKRGMLCSGSQSTIMRLPSTPGML